MDGQKLNEDSIRDSVPKNVRIPRSRQTTAKALNEEHDQGRNSYSLRSCSSVGGRSFVNNGRGRFGSGEFYEVLARAKVNVNVNVNVQESAFSR